MNHHGVERAKHTAPAPPFVPGTVVIDQAATTLFDVLGRVTLPRREEASGHGHGFHVSALEEAWSPGLCHVSRPVTSSPRCPCTGAAETHRGTEGEHLAGEHARCNRSEPSFLCGCKP